MTKTLTLAEMYEDLVQRGAIRSDQVRFRRDELSVWPWAVVSLGTTPIAMPDTHFMGTQNADLEPNS